LPLVIFFTNGFFAFSPFARRRRNLK